MNTREISLSVLTAADDSRGRRVAVEKAALVRNDELAQINRRRFLDSGVRVVSMASSPGAGKTTLLARTLSDLGPRLKSAVIVGDLATDRDAEQLHASGVDAVQIATGGVCHLEAAMVGQAADSFNLDALDLLIIENVGNLVCPAAFDLGEARRVVLLSVTEGEDKPLKYPRIFKTADAVLITKVDIAEATGFDRGAAVDCIQRVAPQATVLEVSARSGAGLEAWYEYLTE